MNNNPSHNNPGLSSSAPGGSVPGTAESEADSANKRAALAGQWRTPPVPVYPATTAGYNIGSNINHPSSGPPHPTHNQQHHQHLAPAPPPPQQQQQQQQQPAQDGSVSSSGSLPPGTHIPSNSEDYAKALQEAYRKGAEAAALMAQQQIPTAASCPNFSTSPHPALPSSSTLSGGGGESIEDAAYVRQVHPTHTSHSTIPDPMAATSMPPPPPPQQQQQQQGQHPHQGHQHHQHQPPQHQHLQHSPQLQHQQQHLQHSPQQQPHTMQLPPPAIHHHHHAPPPQHHHHHHYGTAPPPPPSHSSSLEYSSSPNPPPSQTTSAVAAAASAAAAAASNNSKAPQGRSLSMPDMSTYAAQAEEEKRQKRLARNRASARLRRLRKKNLVDAYETEVGILEKTLKQLKAHEWGRDDNHTALLDALGMERGQQAIPADQRASVIRDILNHQMQQVELLRQAQLEQECLAMLANSDENADDEMVRELQDLLQLTDHQKQDLRTSSQGLEKEIEALETIAASLEAMKENDWLINDGVQAITDQFTSILHKNQLSKFLLWTDANVEAIDQLDHVQVQPLQGAPIFSFGVESTPGDDDDGRS